MVSPLLGAIGLGGLGGCYAGQSNSYSNNLNAAQMQNVYSGHQQFSTYYGYKVERDIARDCWKINVDGEVIKVPDEALDRNRQYRALDQQLKVEIIPAEWPDKLEDVKVADVQTVPDVSLTRVLKWAVVLLIAMGLGKRVWDMFGTKITAQIHKAIGTESGSGTDEPR